MRNPFGEVILPSTPVDPVSIFDPLNVSIVLEGNSANSIGYAVNVAVCAAELLMLCHVSLPENVVPIIGGLKISRVTEPVNSVSKTNPTDGFMSNEEVGLLLSISTLAESEYNLILHGPCVCTPSRIYDVPNPVVLPVAGLLEMETSFLVKLDPLCANSKIPMNYSPRNSTTINIECAGLKEFF
jgi:hypothetical protein